MKSYSTSHALRPKCPLVPPSRYYPYALGTLSSAKEDMKEVVVGLGVELSLHVAESMFLMCDDIHTLLGFCYKLWRSATPPFAPASERLLLVIYHVYSKDIKPKNGAFQDSVSFQLIRTTWKDFCDASIVLYRLVRVLSFRTSSIDDRLLSSAIAQFKQVLKRLEDKLRPAKHVSEANGFAKEMIQSNISHLWKSLFDEELVDLWTPSLFDEKLVDSLFDDEATPNVIRSRILHSLFQPVMGNSSLLRLIQIKRLPTLSSYRPPVYSPYILGEDFAMEEMKEEVVRLGVELSLHVAESMFLLSDDISSIIHFCNLVWSAAKKITPDSCVAKCLLRVIHYVFSKYFKPKNGVLSWNAPQLVQCGPISTSWENFVVGIRYLDTLALLLETQNCVLGREYTSRVEEALKKVGETLRSARDVSEANGFARDAMEPELLDLWKSLFDKETEEA